MINGAISVGFNIVLNLMLVQYMGHAGLAFATSIATTIATILMFYGLKKENRILRYLILYKMWIKSRTGFCHNGCSCICSLSWIIWYIRNI